jgi:glycosyltransferase involved in cell wall biosynthesis
MKKIKIAIIAHNCREGGGLVGTLNLVKAFKDVAQNEQFLLVCSAGYGYEEIELPPNSELFVYRGRQSPPARYWFDRVTLPAIVRRYNPDVIFGPGNTGLTRPGVPQALFIRLPYLFYDKKHFPDMPLIARLRLAEVRSKIMKSLPATELLFCQTPVVKRRLSDAFGYPEKQISILRFPCPQEIVHATDLEVPGVLKKNSDKFYVLLLTRYLTHRNPSVLIPLCKHYANQLREKQVKFITTVQKQDHPLAGRFLEEISRNHLEDVIINVGRLSREDVSRYFSHSHMLWLPTLMETLCIPFLEAMNMGVPILAPDLDFARYVCGEAALFYDPWNIESMFKHIMLLREDECLRRDLIAKGKSELGNRAKFSKNWQEVATDVIRNLRILVEQV